jgi:hypothetical protein
MPPGVWLIFFLVISIACGFVVSTVGMWIYYYCFSIPKEKRSKYHILHIPITLIIALGLTVYLINSAIEHDQSSYWNSRGIWDVSRMPLEKPYELIMIAGFDSASISPWKEDTVLVGSITKYEKRDYWIIGELEDGWGYQPKGKNWFIFDCATGKAEEFSSENDFLKSCSSKGLSAPFYFRSIKENWDTYWENPRIE